MVDKEGVSGFTGLSCDYIYLAAAHRLSWPGGQFYLLNQISRIISLFLSLQPVSLSLTRYKRRRLSTVFAPIGAPRPVDCDIGLSQGSAINDPPI